MVRYAGVEAGGTTWVVAISEGDPSNIVERADFTTVGPAEVLAKVVAWLKPKQFDCLGVASFGPIEVHEDSPKYGFITTTPKPGWNDADILGPLRKGLGLPPNFPVGWDTDVNAPALSEYAQEKAAGRSLTSCAYVTVGTGVGVGLVFNGEMLHGLLHGEGGHISVPGYPGGLGAGRTSYSLNCPTWYELESVTNSAALAARAGLASPAGLKDLPDDHEVWEVASHYLACLCANMILLVSPEKIILSGGVLLRKCLFPKIRAKCQEYLNGYIDVPAVMTADGIAKLIVPSAHGNSAGIVGALFLAKKARDDAAAAAPTKASAPTASVSAAESSGGLGATFASGPFALGLVAGLAVAFLATKSRQ